MYSRRFLPLLLLLALTGVGNPALAEPLPEGLVLQAFGVTMPNTFATVRGELSDIHDYGIGGPALLAGCGSELGLTSRLFLAA